MKVLFWSKIIQQKTLLARWQIGFASHFPLNFLCVHIFIFFLWIVNLPDSLIWNIICACTTISFPPSRSGDPQLTIHRLTCYSQVYTLSTVTVVTRLECRRHESMKVEVKQVPKTLLGVNTLALIIIGIAIKDVVNNKFASENKFNPASRLNQNTRMPALHLERGNTREKNFYFYLKLPIVLLCLFVFTLKYRCKGSHIIEPFPKNVKDIYDIYMTYIRHIYMSATKKYQHKVHIIIHLPFTAYFSSPVAVSKLSNFLGKKFITVDFLPHNMKITRKCLKNWKVPLTLVRENDVILIFTINIMTWIEV